MIKISDIIRELESWAPVAYQESYDNSGLIVGNSSELVTGVLITLDITEEVVQEAIDKKANLIVAHHPIVFKGLKRLTGANYVERTVLKAIKNDVALYAIHTNLDSVTTGVNYKIAQKLGLQQTRILVPKPNLLEKITFFCPKEATSDVLESLYKIGAGKIGNYSNCSFQTDGVGTFKPEEGANPKIGVVNEQEWVAEHRAEVMYPAHLRNKVIQELKKSHPYEEVSYYIHSLENSHQEVGSGMVGELESEMEVSDFLRYLKEKMGLSAFKYTHPTGKPIKRIAICGGSGSFLLGAAKRAQADVFVTADYKYHEFFDAENQLMICDIGHYESEVYTKELIFTYLSEKFDNFAHYLSNVNTNPVLYYV